MLKRLCLIVFSLCGAFCLAALALPWLGPWTREATAWLFVRWYYIGVEAALAVTSVGLLACLLWGLFAPRRTRVVEIGNVEGDRITVTCAAISSQASHVVEREGLYDAERVSVRAHRNDVRVGVRVRPRRAVNLASEGQVLHEELMRGLAALVGDAVRGVDLEFVEPLDYDGGAGFGIPGDLSPNGGAGDVTSASLPQDLASSAGAAGEITVSMGHSVPEEGPSEGLGEGE